VPEQLAEHFLNVLKGVVIAVPKNDVIARLPRTFALTAGEAFGDHRHGCCIIVFPWKVGTERFIHDLILQEVEKGANPANAG
jgi:hypothetical protein